jgi:hypothetical protein
MAARSAAILFLDFDFVLTQATAAIKSKRELRRKAPQLSFGLELQRTSKSEFCQFF